ncbi:MAG: glycosyltransferase [Acidobacteriia bacterium]|nr:glycosyltransferase [Terriglobia bacterium]MBV8903041.1 glycosyltransferase [Terriglobia bacterium]MBV9744950.1 glycosyltransferase [Terriglobia bacterium]
MKLSILMPVYNERTVVERSISQVVTAPLPENMDRELVVVDDCSTDGTLEILKRLAAAFPQIRLYQHEQNRGKGAAVRTAIEKATGDFALIQDADLEYDPAEYPRLLRPLLDGHADAVFGSRYLAGEQTRVLLFWHSVINKGLTLVSNMFCNLNLTDMETCYKVFRTDLLKSIPIRSDRFGFEPEIVMKSAKRKLRIYEVPISYHGRTYEEGKKINWKDGIKALAVIFRFWLIDDLYAAPYGRGVLNNLTGTPQYLSWLSGKLRPHLGDAVLEVGAGIGNVTGRLMGKRLLYMAAEKDPLYLHALRNRFLRTPNVVVQRLDPENPEELGGLERCFDTVLCLNVLEYLESPGPVLEALRATLQPGGRILVLAPQNPTLYGSLDRSLGHKRRYTAPDARRLLESCGFAVERVYNFNKVGTAPWWIYSKLSGSKKISKPLLKIFDKTVWLWSRLDALMPWNGLSIIVVGRNTGRVPDNSQAPVTACSREQTTPASSN